MGTLWFPWYAKSNGPPVLGFIKTQSLTHS